MTVAHRFAHRPYQPLLKRTILPAAQPASRLLASAILGAVLAATLFPLAARADTWPERPLKVIVGFAPGGPTDTLARIFAGGLAGKVGAQVVVENKPGAGGLIGTQLVAKAQPDGYTLLFSGDGALTVVTQLNPNTGYDALKDLVPLRLVTGQVNVLVGNTGKGLKDMPALLMRAKAQPGALTFGSAGIGTPSHLLGALFESATGVTLSHVPYNGAEPAMTDLVGGTTDMMFVGMPVALRQAARKELAIIAVSGDQRATALPDTPTFAELGIKGLGGESGVWWALMAPAGLPSAIGEQLMKAARETLADAGVRKQYAAQGVDVLDRDGATTTRWIERDRERWAKLIAAGKVKGQ